MERTIGLPSAGNTSADPKTREFSDGPNRYKTKTRKDRDYARKANFNREKNKKDLEIIAAKIKAKLWYGFDDCDDAAESVTVSERKEPQPIPVTTRGVGMLTQALYNNVSTAVNQALPCTETQLYRVGLAQLQLKHIEARTAGTPPYPFVYRWITHYPLNNEISIVQIA